VGGARAKAQHTPKIVGGTAKSAAAGSGGARAATAPTAATRRASGTASIAAADGETLRPA